VLRQLWYCPVRKQLTVFMCELLAMPLPATCKPPAAGLLAAGRSRVVAEVVVICSLAGDDKTAAGTACSGCMAAHLYARS
jgi:hypothetical protein